VSVPNPVNAIGVLSRADEVGAGRLDALDSATRIATRYGQDRRLRRLVQGVVPVAGLLAESAVTLTEGEFQALRQLAAAPPSQIDAVLLSVDRFVEAPPVTPLTSIERQELLERFGLYGVRLAVSLLRQGVATTGQQLSTELVDRSGLGELRRVLATVVVDRADVLRARSALLALDRLCADHPEVVAARQVRADVERLLASSHPFQELTTLTALRTGWLTVPTDTGDDLARLLGGAGTAPELRLGLAPGSDRQTITAAAAAALARWQRRAENPLSSHDLVQAARVVIRSLEEVLAHPQPPDRADLASGGGPGGPRGDWR
jgi:hypothetical protein